MMYRHGDDAADIDDGGGSAENPSTFNSVVCTSKDYIATDTKTAANTATTIARNINYIKDTLSGHIICNPNCKNRRDLDITIEYETNNNSDGKVISRQKQFYR